MERETDKPAQSSKGSATTRTHALHLAALLVLGLFIVLFPLVENPEAEGKLRGDGIQYFSYLQSIFEDGDIQFADDYVELYPSRKEQAAKAKLLPTGYAANYFAPGAPLCWAPFYLAGKAWLAVAGAPDREAEIAFLVAAVRLGSRVYVVLSLVLIFFILRRFFDPNISLLGVLAVFFCTAYLHYGLHNTILSHNVGAFGVALFVWLVLRTGSQRDLKGWLLVGAVAGFVALCRWQNGIIVVWLAVEQAPIFFRALREGAGALRLLGRYALSSLLFFAVLSPQFLIWVVIFGPFKTPLDFGANAIYWGRPEIISLLFSVRHGLLSWHPILYLAVIGFFLMPKRRRAIGFSALLALICLIYLNSVTADWWAGDSFGMRRFVSFSAVFALGIASFSEALRSLLRRRPMLAPISVAVALAALNLFLFNEYRDIDFHRGRPPAFGTFLREEVGGLVSDYGYPFAWPGALFQTMAVPGTSPDEADWILTTYLLQRQDSMNGVVKAEYPSFREGFSEPLGEDGVYRLLGGRSGTVYLSRLEVPGGTMVLIDGQYEEEGVGEGEIPLIEVRLEGRHIALLSGRGSAMRNWTPAFIKARHWKLGLNRLELALWVGKDEELARYRKEGFNPLADETVRPNDGDYSLKVYRLFFFPGFMHRRAIEKAIDERLKAEKQRRQIRF